MQLHSQRPTCARMGISAAEYMHQFTDAADMALPLMLSKERASVTVACVRPVPSSGGARCTHGPRIRISYHPSAGLPIHLPALGVWGLKIFPAPISD